MAALWSQDTLEGEPSSSPVFLLGPRFLRGVTLTMDLEALPSPALAAC
jgi:hypothetical protein